MFRCVLVSVLVVVKEWEYKSILVDINDLTREVTSAAWKCEKSDFFVTPPVPTCKHFCFRHLKKKILK